MIFQPFFLACLAHASYLIGSKGEAWVIDPQRDVDEYLKAASAAGLTITGIFETHFHADFVSGHRELAQRTGAAIYMGRKANPQFAFEPLLDGQVLRLGDLELKVLETPGHTPESTCLLVRDLSEPEAPAKLFTGDTLFIGEVGRPDLLGGQGLSSQAMAEQLYDSLHQKLLPLPDDTEVWPAHGAGSACGKNISQERTATLGNQRRFNYALQPMDRETFVDLVTRDLPPPPAYFPRDVALNRQGAPTLEELGPLEGFSPEAFRKRQVDGAQALDLRSAEDYQAAHIPGSIRIGLEGTFATWAGSLIPHDRDLLLVGNLEALDQARMRLARVGLDRVVGSLEGGLDAWASKGLPTAKVEALEPAALAERKELSVLDVRNPRETALGHVPGARLIPLAELSSRLAEVPQGPLAVICAGGYRSLIACGVVEASGRTGPLFNVTGGTGAWVKEGLPLDQPATLGV